MKHFKLAALLALFVVLPAGAAIKEGDVAPAFAAKATRDGKTQNYSLKDALKKGPVVVYFFPTAYGGGCSIQAHGFAEKSEQFAAAGASIVGISLDSIERLNEFSADPEYCAGKFPVVSDADGAISKAYELEVTARDPGQKDKRGKVVTRPRVERTTFIVSPDGKIAKTVGGVAAGDNVDQTLEAVKAWAAAKVASNK